MDSFITMLYVLFSCVMSTMILICYLGRMWIRRNILKQIFVDCRIMREYGENTFRVIFTKYVNIQNKQFTYEKKTYVIDLERAIFDKNNNPILYYLFSEISPITFKFVKDKNIMQKGNPDILNTVILDNTLRKIFGSDIDNMMLMIIIGLIIGLVAMSVYAFWQINQLQQQLIEMAKLIPRPIVVTP